MSRRVDSDGSSVRLNGTGKVLTNPGRGRNGRVHKFNRFKRTREPLTRFQIEEHTKTRDHEEFETRNSGVLDFGAEEV